MFTSHSPLSRARLLAGFGTAALVGAVCLVSSRPAHTAGGPIAVNVANTPLPTTAADNPDKQGVQSTITLPFPNGFGGGGGVGDVLYTVPSGKRLVIDTVTSSTNTTGDPGHYSVTITTFGGLGNVLAREHFNELPDGSPYSVGSSHTHLYAEAGSSVSVFLTRTETSGNTNVSITLTGHLVDIATPGGSS